MSPGSSSGAVEQGHGAGEVGPGVLRGVRRGEDGDPVLDAQRLGVLGRERRLVQLDVDGCHALALGQHQGGRERRHHRGRFEAHADPGGHHLRPALHQSPRRHRRVRRGRPSLAHEADEQARPDVWLQLAVDRSHRQRVCEVARLEPHVTGPEVEGDGSRTWPGWRRSARPRARRPRRWSGADGTRSMRAVGSSDRYAAVIASWACWGSMVRPGRGLTDLDALVVEAHAAVASLDAAAGRELGEEVGHGHLRHRDDRVQVRAAGVVVPQLLGLPAVGPRPPAARRRRSRRRAPARRGWRSARLPRLERDRRVDPGVQACSQRVGRGHEGAAADVDPGHLRAPRGLVLGGGVGRDVPAAEQHHEHHQHHQHHPGAGSLAVVAAHRSMVGSREAGSGHRTGVSETCEQVGLPAVVADRPGSPLASR